MIEEPKTRPTKGWSDYAEPVVFWGHVSASLLLVTVLVVCIVQALMIGMAGG